MNTVFKYSYYVYLVIIAILIFEGVSRLQTNATTAMIFFAIAALLLVKFFITRRFRRNIEKRNQQN